MTGTAAHPTTAQGTEHITSSATATETGPGALRPLTAEERAVYDAWLIWYTDPDHPENKDSLSGPSTAALAEILGVDLAVLQSLMR